MASIGEASKRRVTSTYSSIVEPQTLAMKRVSLKSSCGRMCAHDLIDAGVLQADGVEHPGGVSYTRCGGLPRRGFAGRAL